MKEGITDARQLGYGKFGVLGVQHLFAMFGATILVPALTGLPVSTTLLFAGLGTLVFHLVSKGQVPAFLGSSFAYHGDNCDNHPAESQHQVPPAHPHVARQTSDT